MNSTLQSYYAERAQEHDRVYSKPERQNDLKKIQSYLSDAFEGLDVLEIASGTGYWTQFISLGAQSVLGVDYNLEVIDIAKLRDYRNSNVTFLRSDAYELKEVKDKFSGGFSGFWWSHILKEKRKGFLSVFHEKLNPGAKVVFIDNRFAEGSNIPISRRDEDGNTYQNRSLDDGSSYEILKNFPDKEELEKDFSEFGSNLQIELFEYYWIVSYKTKS